MQLITEDGEAVVTDSSSVVSTDNVEFPPVRYIKPILKRKALTEDAHQFSSLQFIFDNYISSKLRQFARSLLRPEDVIEYEDIPHITVKYGIHDSTADKVFNLLAPFLFNGISCSILNTDLFEGAEDDAVVLRVESEYIRKINTIVSENIENTNTYPEYIPHITLGYVKKGTGNLYIGRTILDMVSFNVGELQFSSKEGLVSDYSMYMYDKSAKWWIA